ncbi:MAG TPA: T9SS type B sorting domain-containing protein [Flavisolibacter sp.]|nr:T9SS type B sorting domain-containing protein [Flavisolibacter sp.]
MKPFPTIQFVKGWCSLFFIIIYLAAPAQPVFCPPNIDFKLGSFSNWECRSGAVAATGGVNSVFWYSSGQVNDRHQLIPPTSTDTDPYGGFPQRCPNTDSYTAKLGNDNTGHEAEGLFYTFTIPASSPKFSLLYYYAIVLQNPGHQVYEQPRFRARVIDVATDAEINCVSFDFSASGSLPGFMPTSTGNGVYKDWTPISVDLSGYAGKTVRLEFITSDCTFQQHFGYAYVSVASSCNGNISGNFYCEGDTSLSLTAPYGFQGYAWYNDASFSQTVSTAQNLSLTVSVTPVGTVLPVIVTPYPGYGCLDTLYATIGAATKPVSRAGPDLMNCSKKLAQLGGASSDQYTYAWSPAQLVSDPFSSAPTTLPNIVTPTYLVVKTTDLETGCFSKDSALVTPIVVDTSSTAGGKTVYCRGETFQTTLSVLNTGAQVQWFSGNNAIASANALIYQPTTAGNYWAEVRESGCVDTTRPYTLTYAAFPKADFSLNKEIQCLNQPISFINKSTIPGNAPMQHLWKFGDGSSLQSANAEKAFSAPGVFTAKLIVTSGSDCKDSIQKTVKVVSICTPLVPTAFTPNNDGKNERFTPFLSGSKGLRKFTIFNRYGNIVFSTTKEGQGWDGRHNGVLLPAGVFVWMLEYTSADDKPMLEKGTVTLIR